MMDQIRALLGVVPATKVEFGENGGALADGANTTAPRDAALLPGENGGTLVALTIQLEASQGPVFGIATILRGGSRTDTIPVSGEFTLGSDSSVAGMPDVFTLGRSVPYPGGSFLRVFLRNDSGAAVHWTAKFGAIPA